ncbi:hypothetical protein BX659_10647 [Orenia metallireducens]|jgi:chromosome segregation ATPase|uniref:Uncharacterized protein n=1 Tax=Orenia metallireducens TaxID=1413210 RepID=A0A285HV43_9FIRM|nr:hypothetical protein [Orenia metallireducens]PRX31015.1 hypothetical protein BX659_10647 [Orenia metallireducens]SNY39565.1 hypothetical protein SAMN06265827_12547 [Orenia metallireducens]
MANMAKYEQEITQIKKELDTANRLKMQSEARMESLKKDNEKLVAEIKEFGVEPDNLEEEIKQTEAKLQELLKQAKEMLPDKDVLQGKVGQ